MSRVERMRINDIRLVNPLTGEPGNFHLREFQNPEGIVILHHALLSGLELLRQKLNNDPEARIEDKEIGILVTCGTRTEQDNERLAQSLGWTDQGGLVSRNSYHLVKHGGVAADIWPFYLTTRMPVDSKIIMEHAANIFDRSIAYATHYHVDMRSRSISL